MNQTRLQTDIENQPASLAGVLRHQLGDGGAAFEAASGVLRSARRIVVTAMGASLNACVPLDYTLCSHGFDVAVVEAAELLHYRQAMSKGAAVLLVSRSGESVEIRRLLEVLKGRAPIIGLTNDPHSLLAREADHALLMNSLAAEMVAIQSYTATVLALSLLGGAIVGPAAFWRDQAESACAELPRLIAGWMDRIAEWDPFLAARSPVYLLGRGPSRGSALEGALLFHEAARAPAVAMAAATFRHGPVEAVDNLFRGVVFAPRGATRSLNLALARDITRFGGDVRVIGPAGADSEGVEVIEVPGVAEPIAPLVEIIPLQIAALRLAWLKGLEAGRFRYATLVTRDEATFGD